MPVGSGSRRKAGVRDPIAVGSDECCDEVCTEVRANLKGESESGGGLETCPLG